MKPPAGCEPEGGFTLLLLPHPILNLGLLHAQHPANLRRRQVLVEQLRDLLEREAEVLESKDTVKPRQLDDRVVSLSCHGVAVGEAGVVGAGVDGWPASEYCTRN